MLFNSMMHIALYTSNMDEMIDFYCNKLGLNQKVIVRYKSYKGMNNRPEKAKLAEENPESIFNVYIEIAEGQFLELFPAKPNQKAHPAYNEYVGYSHFALLVDDIFETRERLVNAGIYPDTEPSKGPSETWQMWYHDPDGNKFEVMQYTEKSYQVVGHID